MEKMVVEGGEGRGIKRGIGGGIETCRGVRIEGKKRQHDRPYGDRRKGVGRRRKGTKREDKGGL